MVAEVKSIGPTITLSITPLHAACATPPAGLGNNMPIPDNIVNPTDIGQHISGRSPMSDSFHQFMTEIAAVMKHCLPKPLAAAPLAKAAVAPRRRLWRAWT